LPVSDYEGDDKLNLGKMEVKKWNVKWKALIYFQEKSWFMNIHE
jgi:hypothetical protein